MMPNAAAADVRSSLMLDSPLCLALPARREQNIRVDRELELLRLEVPAPRGARTCPLYTEGTNHLDGRDRLLSPLAAPAGMGWGQTCPRDVTCRTRSV